LTVRFHEQEIRKLIQCLPSLSELTIDQSLPEISRVLLPDIPQGDATRTQVSAWPQLQTIGIFYLRSVEVPFLCNMRQAGDPSEDSNSAFRRDRRSRMVLREEQRLEWLQEKVIVGPARQETRAESLIVHFGESFWTEVGWCFGPNNVWNG
jgi:hypothetical protein